MPIIRTVLSALGALVLCATAAPAQTWPQRSVKFIIPFGPGAGADIGARLVAERLQMRWGKPVVVENRPGADGIVAVQAFVSANDDHTLLFAATGSFTVHPFQYEKLPYTPADLLPIARVSNTILATGVPSSTKIGTLKEFVERARANPGKFNAAVVPGITEFTFDYFLKTEGLQVTKIPYRDIVQAATDVGEDRVQIMSSSYAILQPQSQAGRIKVVAVNGHDRAPTLPDIPTVIEAGFPSLEQEGLVGLFGPQGMPLDLRERIAVDVVAATKDPAVSARLLQTAQVPNPAGPQEFGASIDQQRALIAKIAHALGIKPKQEMK